MEWSVAVLLEVSSNSQPEVSFCFYLSPNHKQASSAPPTRTGTQTSPTAYIFKKEQGLDSSICTQSKATKQALLEGVRSRKNSSVSLPDSGQTQLKNQHFYPVQKTLKIADLLSH